MNRLLKKLSIINYPLLIILYSCSVPHQISKSADKILLKDSVISTGHIGISIYEPATNSYWYEHDATKYFIPSSNTKLFTLYAGMKYLGDSLVGLRYSKINDSLYYISPTGDPTFLHPDFTNQPVYLFFKRTYPYRYYFFIWHSVWKEKALGSGWAWDDYMKPYMAERSPFPIYGNIIRYKRDGHKLTSIPRFGFDPLPDIDIAKGNFKINRILGNNAFRFVYSDEKFDSASLTLTDLDFFFRFKYLLADTLEENNFWIPGRMFNEEDTIINKNVPWTVIKSQPTDSLFKPMMHRSDNFFAEQTLLMVSNEHLGYMNDEDIIDTLLKADLKDVPQKPRWVDGSGLSGYNLFTPRSFIYILNKMQNEYGLKRLEVILPTGGEGSLKNYYLKDTGYVYAKTGTMSNNNSLSGFLITKKNKLLIFSILLNNYQGDPGTVKCAIQQFLEQVRNAH